MRQLPLYRMDQKALVDSVFLLVSGVNRNLFDAGFLG